MSIWRYKKLTKDQLAHEASITDNKLALASIALLDECNKEAALFKGIVVDHFAALFESVLHEEEREQAHVSSDFITNQLELGEESIMYDSDQLREALCSLSARDSITTDYDVIDELPKHYLELLLSAIWDEEGYHLLVVDRSRPIRSNVVGDVELEPQLVELCEHPFLNDVPEVLREDVVNAVLGGHGAYYYDHGDKRLILCVNTSFVQEWLDENI